MRIIKSFIVVAALILMCGIEVAQASIFNKDFYMVYDYVKRRDADGLRKAQLYGLNVDAEDNNGETALCYTIYQKDYSGYDMLVALHADTNPRCLEAMHPKYKRDFFNNRNFTRMVRPAATQTATKVGPPLINTTTAVAVVGLGTAVALAASGSSGGGSGSDTPGGGDNPSGGDPNNDNNFDMNVDRNFDVGGSLPADAGLPAIGDIENNDGFKKGNFLSQIGAQYAYAKGYNGKIVNRDPATNDVVANDLGSYYKDGKVRVAVVDNGIFNTNPALASNVRTDLGANFDTGPCTGSNAATPNCWSTGVSDGTYITITNGTLTYKVLQSEWASYVAAYAADYVYNAANTTPHEHEVVKNEDGTYTQEGLGSHGTHVAGIIGANQANVIQGVNPNADLIPVIYDKWLGFDDAKLLTKIADLAPADPTSLDGLKVVNLSFGYSLSDYNYENYKAQVNTQFKNQDLIKNIFDKGVIIVAAAGNDRDTAENMLNVNSGLPFLSGVGDSAKDLFINVVAVDGSGKLTDYSNACGPTAEFCLAAPGGTPDSPLWSTVISQANGGTYGDDIGPMIGTSMATPVVSGSISLLMSAFPYLTPQQVVRLLFATADDLGAPEIYGHGLINLDKATRPYGPTTIATGTSVNGEQVSLSGARISIPHTFAYALKNDMGRSFMILDSFSRGYNMPLSNLVSVSEPRNVLKNDLRRFSIRNKAKKIAVNDNMTLSYSARTTEVKDDIAVGSVDFSYKSNNGSSFGFFYTEDNTYRNADYFSKALSNPYLNMNNAFGLNSEFALTDKISFNLETMNGENGFYENDNRFSALNDNRFSSMSAGISFKPSSLWSLSFSSGILQEKGSLLGMRGQGALGLGNNDTVYNSVSVTINPTEKLSVTASYHTGTTEGHNAASGLLKVSDIQSESFALDTRYKLDENSLIGMQLAAPLNIRKGTLSFDLPTSRDDKEDTVYREKFDVALDSDHREISVGTYFAHEVEDGKWFQAEVGARFNPDGRDDLGTDYRMMLGFGASF